MSDDGLEVSPLSPVPRRHQRCLGCEVPLGVECRDCSADGSVRRVVLTDGLLLDHLRRQVFRLRLANTTLVGAVVGLAVVLLYLLGVL